MFTAEKIISRVRQGAFKHEFPTDSGAVYDQDRERLLRWLSAKLGVDVTQRPFKKRGLDGALRVNRDVDFFMHNYMCGDVCFSRHKPTDPVVFPRGWYVSGKRLADLTTALRSHQYACIIYGFGDGSVYWINLNVAALADNHEEGQMEPAGGRQSSGIYIKPQAFNYLGNMNEPG